MRTEDDLRAAYDALGRHAPHANAVLRTVHDHSRRPSRLRRLSPRLLMRRPLHVSMAVAAAAAITAAAVVLTTAPGPVTSSRPAAAAPLRARLLAAIDAVRGDILFTRAPSSEGGTWISPSYPRPGQQVRVRILGLNAHGIPGKDAEYIFAMPARRGAASGYTDPIDWGVLNVSGTIIVVDHARHTWGEWHHANITSALPLNQAGIRSEIANGQLHVITRTTLRRRQAIELAMTLTPGNGAALQVTTAHLWVDAATYLPMRQLLQFSDGKQDLTDYTFLPPTPANLAKLRPVIPAGYQQTTRHPGQRPKK